MSDSEKDHLACLIYDIWWESEGHVCATYRCKDCLANAYTAVDVVLGYKRDDSTGSPDELVKMRVCGVCGERSIPYGVNWPWWGSGMPVHPRCINGAPKAQTDVPL